MDERYIQLFKLVSAPLILISGLGIYILMLNARYTHVIARVREFYATKKKATENLECYDKDLITVIQRAKILKWSMGLLVLSTVFSSFLVLLSIANMIIGIEVFLATTFILPVISILIMGSMILLFVDIKKSLTATLFHVNYCGPE